MKALQVRKEVNEVVPKCSKKNAKYIAPDIHKEILNIMSNKVRQMIYGKVRYTYFCILVNEENNL